jgi:hypothetical protein
MRTTKSYNNLNEKSVPKLGRGEVALFRICGIKPDPVNEGRLMIPTAVSVPSTDTVYDPSKKEYVDIACIDSIGADGKPNFVDIWFRREAAGTIVCNGNNRLDTELYSYLMLSNYRKNNENRNGDQEAIYELIDTKAQAAKKREDRSKRLEALQFAANMTGEEVVETIASMGLNENQDIQVLRDRLEAFAEEDPESFLKIVSNKNKAMKANVKKALDQGVLVFDRPQNAFKWAVNEEIITTVPRSTGTGHLDGFVGFLLGSKKGEKVYDEIVKLLK